MKREIPMIITALVGLAYLLFFFIPHWPFNQIGEMLQSWFIIIAAFAILLGVGSLIKVHGNRLSRRTEGWPFSIVLLLGLLATAAIGVFGGIGVETSFDYIFKYFYTPMGSTMFSLLAFFIASASFRAFRAQSKEATMLLVAAFIMMLSRVPLGGWISVGLYSVKIVGWIIFGLILLFSIYKIIKGRIKEAVTFIIFSLFILLFFNISFPKIGVWIMAYPTTAGQRAIMIGAALGVVSTSIKILLGIDKSYLGGD